MTELGGKLLTLQREDVNTAVIQVAVWTGRQKVHVSKVGSHDLYQCDVSTIGASPCVHLNKDINPPPAQKSIVKMIELRSRNTETTSRRLRTSSVYIDASNVHLRSVDNNQFGLILAQRANEV